MLGDPALQGLGKFLVVEPLTEILEQELRREDGRTDVGEAVIQDSEEGRLHRGCEAVVSQVVDEENRDPRPLGDERVLLAGIGGFDRTEHELVGRDIGARDLELLTPAP